MDKEFQTSFIPKKAVVEEISTKRSRPVGILFLISIILFIVSVLFAVAVYFYKGYLIETVNELSVSLDRAQDEFEKGVIDELERLDMRLDVGQKLLSSHTAVSPVFKIFEDTTLKTVRFSDFSFEKDEIGGLLVVKVEGEALSFTDLALQSDLFTKNQQVRNPIFSDLKLGEKGTVGFSLAFSVTPTLVRLGEELAETTESIVEDTTEEITTDSEIENTAPSIQLPSIDDDFELIPVTENQSNNSEISNPDVSL